MKTETTSSSSTLVWDLPVRLFHWLLVACFAGAWLTSDSEHWRLAHVWFGYGMAGLVGLRLVWGLVGTQHARFASFVRGPAAIRAYLKGEWFGAGHNPIGALSVLAMLGLLATQAATGLFANDDVAFEGYLYPLVNAAVSDKLTGVHKLLEPALMLLVLLHVGAIIFYTRI